ncbi:MAG: hypothetical protein HY858_09130 [Candidatus Solibacter usitatus]|nr:hypothetical protein [Candidatus Solibacter usitatus]
MSGLVLATLALSVWPAARGDELDEVAAQLPRLKRVFIDKFGGGEGASQLRDMMIASLQRARVFVVTENAERADAVMRGSAEDLVFTDIYQSNESVGARAGVSVGRGATARSRDSASLGAGVSESEGSRIQERKHEASASVRLVNKDGDVIWSTTQESQGAKFRSASADVADKVTRQLLMDMEKARERGAKGGAGSR